MDQQPPERTSAEFERYNRDERDRSAEARMLKHRHRARYLIDGARGLGGLAGHRLLDAGCGQGLLLSLIPEAAQLHGFDANAALLANSLAAGRAELGVRDIFATGYADAQFDVVFCSEVLEHLQDPRRALIELARVTRPGGLLAASVPCAERIAYEVCVHCGKATPRHGHLHSFDEAGLAALLPAPYRLVSTLRVCAEPVYIRLHPLPVPLFRMLDRLALALRPRNARWLVFFARREA